MGWASRKSTDPRRPAATANPARGEKELPRREVLGERLDLFGWALMAVGLVIVVVVAACRWSRGVLFGPVRAREVGVLDQSRIGPPEAVVRTPDPEVIEVTPAEYRAIALAAQHDPRSVSLLLDYRLPGYPVVYPAVARVAERLYRIVPVRPSAVR
jgi:hypothetical protein